MDKLNRNFSQFLTSNVHFVRKGCDGKFTSVFDVQRPFRAKGLRWILQNRNFASVFVVQRLFRAKWLRFRGAPAAPPRLKRETERRAREDVKV